MKKLFLMASALMVMASCGGSKDGKADAKNDQKDNKAAAPAAVAAAPAQAGAGLRVAFVEVDSLMTQYQFCKDYSELLAKEYAEIQQELAGKERTLQQHAANVQRKFENNEYSTRDELERAQNSINREQQELAALGDKRSAEFAEKQAKFDKEMRDSIQSFLSDYNANHAYDYILSKGGDNMLYANPAFNITNDVVDGLNSRYKTSDEVKAKLGK